jgi:hypothetical protein
MDSATVEMFSLSDDLRWKGHRHLALALMLLAVVMATLAVTVAALLILY